MRAILIHQFGDPQVMRLEEIPDPTPGPGQVLVGVHAAGVNPVETYIRSGQYAAKPNLPYTPGNDAGGVVESVGPVDAQSPSRPFLTAGARVYVAGSVSGTYAEKTLALASKVHPLPDHVSYEQGAAIGVPYATAHRTLFTRAAARPGESVLIHGASGGVGIAGVQLARRAGLSVFGTAGSDAGRDLVAAQGAHHVLNHHDPHSLAQLMTLTNNQGVNIILEMLANQNLARDLTILSQSGRVIIIGSRGKVEIDPRDTMARSSDIRGMMFGHATESEMAEIHRDLVAGLEYRTLNPVIAQRFPLTDAPGAHIAVMQPGHLGKIVLIP